jgi:Family of unknown function (DUF6236)
MVHRYGLYFPYIHVRDEAWLRAVALYRPRMLRIVPASYPTRDSDTVRALVDALGFITDKDPAEAARSLAPTIHRVLDNGGDQIWAQYGITGDSNTDILYQEIPRARQALHDPTINPFPFDAGPRPDANAHGRWGVLDLAGVHVATVDPALTERLIEMRLAVPLSRGPWIGMVPNLAWAYMCMLADEIARAGRLIPMTDQTEAHTMIGAPAATALAGRAATPAVTGAGVDDIREHLAHLAVRTAVPADLAVTPIAEIIKLRTSYSDDFDAFTAEIDAVANELATALQTVTDPQIVELHLQDAARQRFAQPTKKIQKAIRAAGHDTAFSVASLKLELPGIAAAVPGVAALAANHPIAATTASAALLAFSTRRAARKSLAAAAPPSAASYLMRVQDGLTPRSLLGQVRRSTRQLVGLTP